MLLFSLPFGHQVYLSGTSSKIQDVEIALLLLAAKRMEAEAKVLVVTAHGVCDKEAATQNLAGQVVIVELKQTES